MIPGAGGSAGGNAGDGIVRVDFSGDLDGTGKPGNGIAAGREGGSVGDSEAVDASEGVVNSVVFTVHGFLNVGGSPTEI